MSQCKSSTPVRSASTVAKEHAQEVLSTNTPDVDCSICLQKCLHPVKLPCSHVFCYLCCKGEGIKRKRCALCRSEIPPKYFNDPTLLEEQTEVFSLEDGCQWFYEGRNGWWQYDERSSVEIEESYQSGVDSANSLIAGHIYVIDFRNMRQHRINQPGRFRRIKRDLYSVPKKGVAGLRKASELSARDEGDGVVNENDNGLATNANNNTYITPSGSSSEEQQTIGSYTAGSAAPTTVDNEQLHVSNVFECEQLSASAPIAVQAQNNLIDNIDADTVSNPDSSRQQNRNINPSTGFESPVLGNEMRRALESDVTTSTEEISDTFSNLSLQPVRNNSTSHIRRRFDSSQVPLKK